MEAQGITPSHLRSHNKEKVIRNIQSGHISPLFSLTAFGKNQLISMRRDQFFSRLMSVWSTHRGELFHINLRLIFEGT